MKTTSLTVLIAVLGLIAMSVWGIGFTQPLIDEKNDIWVDFNVSGTIRVNVEDTNCGEVPDEAWEEVRRLLSKCDALKDIKFETVGHTLIESENNLIERTNTDANIYMVTVAGKVRGDNTEEAKEHFWENICSEVSGNWCIVELED